MGNEERNGVLRAPAELTVAAAAAFHPLLLEEVQRAQRLTVDLDAVVEFDTAGVQLLLAARRALVARGGELHLRGGGEAVREAIAILGLVERLPWGEAAEATGEEG